MKDFTARLARIEREAQAARAHADFVIHPTHREAAERCIARHYLPRVADLLAEHQSLGGTAEMLRADVARFVRVDPAHPIGARIVDKLIEAARATSIDTTGSEA